MAIMMYAKQEHEIERKLRRKSALLFSLIIHMLAAIIYLFVPQEHATEDMDTITVEWVKDIPPPRLRRPTIKPPLESRTYKPEKRLLREAENKLSQSSPNKIAEVARRSERLVFENLEHHEAPVSDRIPEMMTDAELRDAEASNVERLVSQLERADGSGVVTGRVRVRGDGLGRFLTNSYGNSENGLIGGDGELGMADSLGIINFLNEFDGLRQVVYCLDVSASMQAPGLKKLELAVQSIKDSLLVLDDADEFNIVTFSARAQSWKRDLVKATLKNEQAAAKYLDRFTPERIINNQGTNLLGAIGEALEIKPSVIILVTDGLPAVGPDKQRLLFSLDIQFQVDLNKNRLSALQSAFENRGFSISSNAALITDMENFQWQVVSDAQTFYVRKEGDKLNVYRKGTHIETHKERILEAVRAKNLNRTSIYVVGLEISLGRSPGAELLVRLAKQNNGRITVFDHDDLLKRASQHRYRGN